MNCFHIQKESDKEFMEKNKELILKEGLKDCFRCALDQLEKRGNLKLKLVSVFE